MSKSITFQTATKGHANAQAAAVEHAGQQAAGAGPDAQTICSELDNELVRALGLLHKAPRGIPELTIASLDYGDRSTLTGYRLITSEKREDNTLNVTLTPLGKDVIKLCSEDLPTLEGSELASAVKDAEDLLSLADKSRIRAVPA